MQRPYLITLALGSMLLGFGFLTAADDAKQDAIKKDRKKYEGTWRVTSLEINGNKSSDEDAKKITVVNKADGTWILQVDGEKITEGTSEIDPTKNPKTIDFMETEGDNKGKIVLGIYELRDDTRKLCYAEPGRERPSDFSAPAGSGRVLVEFKREKN
ncbi:MAG TPA: TIGR03067 domain-containing protein [Gemmataceae bacterium]|nr:TIGR03067 domain-containing protein [Gemmataceae bacterium]